MKPISFIVMDNIMGDNIVDVTKIYDLKGSTFGRISEDKGNLSVLKDLNFKNNKEHRLKLSERMQMNLLDRLEKDKEFLKL